MHSRDGKWWTTCQLTVEPDGRYDFQFDYGPPYRLSGNLNDRRYVDYLDRYKAEKGAEPSRVAADIPEIVSAAMMRGVSKL